VTKCQLVDSGLDIPDIVIVHYARCRDNLTRERGTLVRPTLELSPLVDEVGIKLTGEVDLATARQLIDALATISTDSDVHLELAELTFMDSSGLGAILAFARSRNGAGPLVMLNPSDDIERLFVITGLEQHPKIEVRHTRG
jgi:anti-anti-sigma factor